MHFHLFFPLPLSLYLSCLFVLCPNPKKIAERKTHFEIFVELIDKKWVMHTQHIHTYHTWKLFNRFRCCCCLIEKCVLNFWWVFSDDAIISNDKFYSWETNWNHFEKTRERTSNGPNMPGEKIEKTDNLTLWRLRCLNTLFRYMITAKCESERVSTKYSNGSKRFEQIKMW